MHVKTFSDMSLEIYLTYFTHKATRDLSHQNEEVNQERRKHGTQEAGGTIQEKAKDDREGRSE